MDLEWSRPLWVLAIIVLTHWLGAIAGFGSTLLAMPALLWFLDVDVARTVLLLIGTVQAYQVLAATYRSVNWSRLSRMILFTSLGLPVGVLAVRFLPEAPLLVLLGLVLLGSGVSGLRRREGGPAARWPEGLLNSLLVVGGIIHGAFVSGGATLVVYAQHRVPEKDAFRGTLCMFWVVVNTILVGVLLAGGGVGEAAWPTLAAGLPAAMLATWLANRKAGRLSQPSFVKLVAVLLTVAGLVTLGKMAMGAGVGSGKAPVTGHSAR